jgi:hypothetical protein
MDQHWAHGAGIAEATGEMASGQLGRRSIGRIWAVIFTDVDNQHPGSAGSRQLFLEGLNGTP